MKAVADARVGTIKRSTKETEIAVTWNLDEAGTISIDTGIGFFDHMLTALAKHGLFSLDVRCQGDLQVDGHHTVEDVGICMGKAFAQAIGDAQGITRFGNSFVPMDEALVHSVLDISGRAFLRCDLELPQSMVGSFDASLTEEFLRAFAMQAGVTLHVRQLAGSNSHHIIEATFKALGQALTQAADLDPRISGTLSTKGSLM